MHCRRCDGLIVMEAYPSGAMNEGLSGVGRIRCVNCGATVDWGMLRNRIAQRGRTVHLAAMNGRELRRRYPVPSQHMAEEDRRPALEDATVSARREQ